MEDQGIVTLYWQRNERAIEETAAKYGAYCHSIAFHILGNHADAEECVNDTYHSAWKSIPPNRPAVLSTYLGKITRRISFKRWRSRDAQKRGGGELTLSLEELKECIPDRTSVDDGLMAAELSKTIDAFLLTLPANDRRVFVRRYWYCLSIAEISLEFGYSQSKTESILYRVRKKLLARLIKEGYFDEA